MGLYQDVKEDVNGNALVNINDGTGNPLSSTGTSLDVNITGGSSSGSVADQTAFAYGVDDELPVGGVFNDTGATLTSGTTGALRLTAERGLHINLRNAAGTEIGTGANPVRVDPTGTTTQPISAVSLPLPAGAATETTLAAMSAKLSPSGAALTQVARSNVSQSMLALNAARKGFIATNDSGAVCYVAFAATATVAAYTYRLQANSTIEPNFGSYTGAMSVIWGSNGAGNLVITELT